jgi:hypothetical protein
LRGAADLVRDWIDHLSHDELHCLDRLQ